MKGKNVGGQLVTQDGSKSERGASLVEYSILVALIAIVAIVAVREVGESTHNQFAEIVTNLGGEALTKY